MRFFDAETGAALPSIADPAATFTGICLGPDVLFADGFESGDTAAWSLTTLP